MKLTIEHLAPYLPYGLKIGFEGDEFTYDLVGLEISAEGVLVMTSLGDFVRTYYENARPILIPLHLIVKNKELCNEINLILEPNGLEINNFLLLRNSLENVSISWMEMLQVMQLLFKNHYDVFGLIDKGLAKILG